MGGFLPDLSAGGADREDQELGSRGSHWGLGVEETLRSGVGELLWENDLRSALLRARSCHGSWEAAGQDSTGHLIVLSLQRRTASAPTPLFPCGPSESPLSSPWPGAREAAVES